MRSGVTDIDKINKIVYQYPEIADSITKMTSKKKKVYVGEIMRFKYLVTLDLTLVLGHDAEALASLQYLTEIDCLQVSQLSCLQKFLQMRSYDDMIINNIVLGMFTDYTFQLKNGIIRQLPDHKMINQETFDFFIAIKLKKLVISELYDVTDPTDLCLDEVYYYPVTCTFCWRCEAQILHTHSYDVVRTFIPLVSKFSLHPNILDEKLTFDQFNSINILRNHIHQGNIFGSDKLIYLHFPVDIDNVEIVIKLFPNLKELGIGFRSKKKLISVPDLQEGDFYMLFDRIDSHLAETIIRKNCMSLDRIILFSKFFDDNDIMAHLIKTFPQIVVV